MLERNIRIKEAPERFQDCHDKFDVIFSCEERVYDQIIEELSKRDPVDYSTVHVINYDIPDNHEDAIFGAMAICKMAEMISQSTDLDNDIDELLQEFETLVENPIIHSVGFQ